MRKKLLIYLIMAVALLLAGCSGRAAAPETLETGGEEVTAAPDEAAKLRVVSTIFPQYDFVREIAGEDVELSMLLSPGAESHSFEPTPQNIIEIQNSDVFIYVGGDSDEWVDRILGSMDTSQMRILAMMDMVETVEEELVEGMEGGHDDEDDHDDEEGELDEHVWASPRNAKIIVREISNVLQELDPERASVFEENTLAYLEKLDALDEEFQAIVSEAARDTLVFGDRFPFRYFADAYNLTYYAAFPGCSTETEASAKTVAFLIDKVNDEGIPVVFYTEFSNEKMADTICESSPAKKLLLHSCHNISRDDFQAGIGYLDLMGQNAEHLREALN